VRAPSFWSRPAGILMPLLGVAGLPYHLATRLRIARGDPLDIGVPVICVGNFTAGGSGKTPAAIAIAKRLIAARINPVFLSRGYGGSAEGPLLPDPEKHHAADVGDEPLLLCRTAPVVVAKDRQAGARLAGIEGADAIIMDDGLQDPSLEKTLTIAVVDGATGIGNGLVLPAGPLRARLGFQLGLADAILIVGPGAPGDAVAAKARAVHLPIYRAAIGPTADAPDLSGAKVVAFAGIARPEKLFQSLRAAGAAVTETVGFPDHHDFSERDADRLLELAAFANAKLVTTEKDFARLGDTGSIGALRAASQIYPVEMAFENEAGFTDLIRRAATGQV
jgi:tetraacyldisaccharide 4'-kinase